MPDGRPSAPWCMVQLSGEKPSKKALTSCAVAANGSPFNFSTACSPATGPMPAPISIGNPGGIMCGGQACMGKAPIGIAAPYMAGRSGEAAATLAEHAKPQPQACFVCQCDVNNGEGALGTGAGCTGFQLLRTSYAARAGVCLGCHTDAIDYG